MRKKDMPRNLLNQLKPYMYKHIRTMMNPRWKDEAWCPEKETIQNNTAIGDETLAEQDANYDNDHANTRHQDNTPEAMRRDSDPEAETTSTVENNEQRHKGKFRTTTIGQMKRTRIRQERRTYRNYASSSNKSRNAGRDGSQQRKLGTACRTHSGIPDEG